MSKPSPVLTQMPWNVKKKIVEFSNAYSLLSLRRSSKEFKALVDKAPVSYPLLTIQYTKGIDSEDIEVTLKVNDHLQVSRKFSPNPRGFTMKNRSGNWEKQVETEREEAFLDESIGLLAGKVFKRSNVAVRIVRIHCGFDRDVGWQPSADAVQNLRDRKGYLMDKIKDAFSLLPFQIPIETLELYMAAKQDDLLSVLPYFQPGTLKRIHIFSGSRGIRSSGFSLDQRVTDLEQWKQAKILKIMDVKVHLEITKCAHFNELLISPNTMSVDELQFLLQNFTANLDFIRTAMISKNFPKQDFINFFSRFKKVSIHLEDAWEIEIPGSTDYLLANVFYSRVGIDRRSRED